MNKTCTKCGETKPTTEFQKDKAKSDGLKCACRACTKIEDKAYYEANPEKIKARHKAYREANPEKEKARHKTYREANPEKVKAQQRSPAGKFREYKASAKKRGIPFDLTREQINALWQKPCHYCGAEIKTIGLDRVDNDGPYHIDNVVPCCRTCNISKLASTLEEWLERKNDREKETEIPCNA